MLTGNLRTRLGQYIMFLQNHKQQDEKTWKQTEGNLRNHILPYFLDRDTPIREPGDWPGVSIKLTDYLLEKGVTSLTTRRCLLNLAGFWTWMRDEGLVHSDLRLRNPPMELAKTPLKIMISPSEMFIKIAKIENPRFRFIALVGYFFSLRPQEIFGLRVGDFRGGSKVADLECTKAMHKIQLYSKLAVRVQRQRGSKTANIKRVKTAGSEAWAACFNQKAAEMIVNLIKQFEAEANAAKEAPDICERWFPHGYKWYSDHWAGNGGRRVQGIPGLKMKDLRRASLYWLGFHTESTLLDIMKHARHANDKTTLLYLRRPDEEVEDEGDVLDLLS